jgi:four helix bundle protein
MSCETFKKELEIRTRKFAVQTLNALARFPEIRVLRVVVYQLSKSATSVGANYREANRAESKDDFIHKLGIVVKESSETVYWLEICQEVDVLSSEEKSNVQPLLVEAKELYALFQSISRSVRCSE